MPERPSVISDWVRSRNRTRMSSPRRAPGTPSRTGRERGLERIRKPHSSGVVPGVALGVHPIWNLARLFGLRVLLPLCVLVRPTGSASSHAAEVPVLPPLPVLIPVAPETAAVYEKVSLTDAVRRALARNPTAVIAAQEVKRAEALLVEARAGWLPTLTLNASLLRLDADRVLTASGLPTGQVVGSNVILSPGPAVARVIGSQNQQSASLVLNVPLVAPQRWVQWSQADGSRVSAQANSEDVQRTLATTVARAYLTIISQKRQVDILARAVAADRSHFEYTHTRFAGGVGNRVDEVRAAQQLAADQAQFANSFTTLARAREALGLLLAQDKPVDTLDDVSLDDAATSFEDAAGRRQDVRAARQRALLAEKVRKQSWADYTPTLSGQLQPFYQHPATLTQPETGWQAMLVLTFPLVEGGIRVGQMRERDAVLAQARAQYDGLLRQTRADLRVAGESIRRADEALRSAQAAAELAHQALDLANLAYGAGATTNIEVVDAERRARDADSAVVIAEDTVRQARLDLLVAAGRFP
jgi:outer membrane protein TolC